MLIPTVCLVIGSVSLGGTVRSRLLWSLRMMAGATQSRVQDDLLKTVVEMTITKREIGRLARFLEEFAESDNASEKDKSLPAVGKVRVR